MTNLLDFKMQKFYSMKFVLILSTVISTIENRNRYLPEKIKTNEQTNLSAWRKRKP